MVLTETQIKDLIRSPKSPAVDNNIKRQSEHKVHIQGAGYETVLKQIIGYESVEAFKQKKLLTKPFTRPIFKKIINSQSRWKSALGTTRFYQFNKKNDKLAAEFKKKVLSQVWKNDSIEVLVKKFLSKAIYEEFGGFFVIEKPKVVTIENRKYLLKEGILKPYTTEDLMPYVVFKCASEVYTYKQTGETVEFIVFEYGKIKRNGIEITLYRVIDDEKDYIVEKVGDKNVYISQDPEYKTIEHKAGKCPVVPITTINASLTNDNEKTSPVDDIINLLDYYLHQFAEHLVTEILHAHPNFFQVGQKCMEIVEGSECNLGKIVYSKNGEDVEIVCPKCKGTGHNLHKDASTTIIIPAKDENGNPFNLTNIAGYVSPPVDALNYQQASIDWMEQKILDAALGINNVSHGDNLKSTATEAMINIKPLEDIISDIIDIIESREKAVTDLIGKVYYGDKYITSEIIYGRRLSLRDENALMKELKESKQSGTSYNHIKALNEELTYSRFIRSNYDLQRAVILNEVEPLIGLTFDEVEKSQNISSETKRIKQNFTDLINKFEVENGSIIDYESAIAFPKKIAKIKEILLSYVKDSDDGNEQPPEGVDSENGTETGVEES